MKPVKLYALVDDKGKVIKNSFTVQSALFVYTSRKQAQSVRRDLIRLHDYKQIKIIKLEGI